MDLDIAGSNPVTHPDCNSFAEHESSVPAGGRRCGPEILSKVVPVLSRYDFGTKGLRTIPEPKIHLPKIPPRIAETAIRSTGGGTPGAPGLDLQYLVEGGRLCWTVATLHGETTVPLCNLDDWLAEKEIRNEGVEQSRRLTLERHCTRLVR